ncbi:hypothetical protein LPJ64_004795 [Coemansia asiatica]|uniref:Enoyl reductase (ER) domain-containing protein n=1 Tax=Coemansia asiatica TaxID=1052880 RepID=A0A9W8CI85_9FUNG|nr:hypothetical protein LPJ64_004795 [Coemansia asiatica]KAJ2888754.1 hypothetical protein FB639_000426 [Coemansia asiatica]
MKAVLVKQPGGVDQLYIGETEKPTPKPNEVLIKVHCFALNRMDAIQREGKYPVPPDASQILGVEVAGEIAAVGSQTTKFKTGDKVFALMYGGAYAQYAAVDEGSVHPLGSLSMELASSLLECWYTAYQAVHYIGKVQEGDDVLIHAAAGGVGTAAIQLAKKAGARRIFITASRPEKLDYCRSLGATHPINYREQSFKDEVLRETEGRGVDVICDYLLASYFNDNIECLATDGRMSLQGLMGGSVVQSANLAPLLYKRLLIEGSALRSRSLEYQRKLGDAFRRNVLPLIESGEFKWHVDRVFDWEHIKDAHQMLDEAAFTGKIVVRVTESSE